MSRTLFEAVPMTAEVDLRLRRIENRITGIEAALRDRAPAPPPKPAVNRRWAEIVARLDALALKLHYEQIGGDGMPRALDELRDSVQDAFTATGNAIQDEAVRADAREVGQLVAETVADSLSTVSGDVREALRH